MSYFRCFAEYFSTCIYTIFFALTSHVIWISLRKNLISLNVDHKGTNQPVDPCCLTSALNILSLE